jgi:hypothetical protein
MHINVTDDAVLIDNKDRPFAVAFAAQDAILLRQRAVRPEIRQQGVRNSPQAFRPGVQAVLAVNADTQDLGIYPLELV